MRRIKRLYRLAHINFVLAKHGVDEVILDSHILSAFRFLTYLNPWNWVRGEKHTRGERVRLALTELGPFFVKFGQMLSTRPDLFPADIVEELSKLQDNVPAFAGATEIVEKVYGVPLSSMFMEFEHNALASASVAQVHSATLLNGKEVVVKVLRPGVKRIIKRDIDLLFSIANLAEKYSEAGQRLRAVEIVEEFERTLLHELDLTREAANASMLKRNFADSDMLYIPEIHWEYARTNVMIMEKIHGIPIANIQKLHEAKINMKLLAERGVEIFFTQVFRDCFFHGDMHPGNIFVSKDNPNNPQYIAVDFGIIGTLGPIDQRYLAENMLAFFKRDYHKVSQLHIDSGWIPATTRVDEFESAIRTVCEPIFEKPLKDISFGRFLLSLFQVGKQFDMQVQPQLLLLQKTLLHIEGLGRQLYPELDLWSTAKPHLEKWLRKKMGVKAALQQVQERAPYWLERLPEVPDLLYSSLTYMHQQSLPKSTLEINKPRRKAQRKSRKSGLFGAAIGLLLGAAVVISSGTDWWPFATETASLAGGLALTGGVLLLVNLFR